MTLRIVPETDSSDQRIASPLPEALKPCPFDAGSAILIIRNQFFFPHHVECTVCKARTDSFRQRNLAVSAWNKRAEG